MSRFTVLSEGVSTVFPFQGGLLDMIPVEAFGIVVLAVVGIIVLSGTDWAWISGQEAVAPSTAFKNRRQPGPHLGVLYCAADQFGSDDESAGNAVGNEVVSTLVERIRECVREGDTVRRTEGGAILVLLPSVHTVENVLTVADKIRRNGIAPIDHQTDTIHPTLSIGATLALVGESVTDATTRADAAMSMAKQAGPNLVKAA